MPRFYERCYNFLSFFFKIGVILVFFFLIGVFGVFGGARQVIAREFAVFTNRRNKGLISVDRRTSLLSYLQYPVPYQSRLQRIYRSQCPKGD